MTDDDRKHGGIARATGALLVAASLGTGAIAGWLILVSLVVLPQRDPDRVPLWLAVAGLAAAFSGVSAVSVSQARRRPVWLAFLGALALAATAFGAFCVSDTLQRIAAGRGFEGYLLLIGAVLAGHGLAAGAYIVGARAPRAV